MKTSHSHVKIRRAVRTDAASIIRSHISAIRGTASPHYPRAVIDEWASPGSEERQQKFAAYLASDEAVVFVAELEGNVIGFSELIPQYNEVRAVYVSSDYGGRGVGSLLLKALEEEARQRGLAKLKLSSSVNACEFYQRHGFRILEKSVHRLRSGAEMDCYKMEKDMALSETQPY